MKTCCANERCAALFGRALSRASLEETSSSSPCGGGTVDSRVPSNPGTAVVLAGSTSRKGEPGTGRGPAKRGGGPPTSQGTPARAGDGAARAATRKRARSSMAPCAVVEKVEKKEGRTPLDGRFYIARPERPQSHLPPMPLSRTALLALALARAAPHTTCGTSQGTFNRQHRCRRPCPWMVSVPGGLLTTGPGKSTRPAFSWGDGDDNSISNVLQQSAATSNVLQQRGRWPTRLATCGSGRRRRRRCFRRQTRVRADRRLLHVPPGHVARGERVGRRRQHRLLLRSPAASKPVRRATAVRRQTRAS